MTVQIEIDCRVLSMLVRLQWLEPKDCHQRCEIADAIERLLANAARG
jgi:hypothetical protein